MKDFVMLRGRVRLLLGGVLIREGRNLVVSAGNVLIATIFATTGTRPSHFALGSSTTASSASMTALTSEVGSRFAITTSRVSNIITYEGSYTAVGDLSIAEIGIFNASSSGDMLARFVTQSFTMTATAVLEVSWSLTIGE